MKRAVCSLLGASCRAVPSVGRSVRNCSAEPELTSTKLSGAALESNALGGGDPISKVAQQYGASTDADSPFERIKEDLKTIANHIDTLVERRDNEVMDMAAAYLLQNKGKMLRPALVALSGYAAMPGDEEVCKKLHGMTMLEMMRSEKGNLDSLTIHPFNRHMRLAEVTELVHTASLIHDDCLDESETRRGRPALHTIVGVKVAVLAGDYMLARASNYLATLEDTRVVQAMSQALEDLPVGEIMQLQSENTLEAYLKKSFCKTSSLIAHSCRGAAILSNPQNEAAHQAVFEYGKHLGLAFQIVDDVLDFTATDEELGKPAMNDIKCGVYTLPVLLAARGDTKMETLLERKFCMEGDVEQAITIMERLGCIDEAKARAKQAADEAIAALNSIDDSCAKDSMIKLLDIVLSRKK